MVSNGVVNGVVKRDGYFGLVADSASFGCLNDEKSARLNMPRNFFFARRSGVVLLILAGLLMAWSPSLPAQTAGTGALTGTVTDPSGAVVPNATVTATSLDTSQARTATTGADGNYKIGLVPPGNYRVTFEAAGFKAVEVPSATVTVTETAVLDRTLEVGVQEQTVTVASEVETIQTASSAQTASPSASPSASQSP